MKKLQLPFLIILLFSACNKQKPDNEFLEKNSTDIVNEENGDSKAKNANNFNVCHHQPNGTWQIKNITINTWPTHQAHGDVRLDDQDNDGYVPNNACGYGTQGDCDDNNAFIYPGVAEICNGIDDNCNGVIDESCFPAVIIGNQVWMARNLDVTTYRDGHPISGSWGILDTTGAFAEGGGTNYVSTYGRLYNGFAVYSPRGLAPAGWHIPSEYEVNTLLRALDPLTDTTSTISTPSFIAGGLMKETGTAHWLSPNGAATNASGFTALPGGLIDDEGGFGSIGTIGQWWTSTGGFRYPNPQGGGELGNGRCFNLFYTDGRVVILSRYVHLGGSVRCVRNE